MCAEALAEIITWIWIVLAVVALAGVFYHLWTDPYN